MPDAVLGRAQETRRGAQARPSTTDGWEGLKPVWWIEG